MSKLKSRLKFEKNLYTKLSDYFLLGAEAVTIERGGKEPFGEQKEEIFFRNS